MGKTLFAAVVAAILASIATTLLLSSLDAEEKKSREEQQVELRKEMRREAERVDVALARVERMEKRLDRATNAVIDRVATNDEDGVTPGVVVAPDGTPYLSRKELERILDERGAKGLPDGVAEPIVSHPPKPLEEIAADMNLGASEEAALRNALREQEEEMVKLLFGDRPLSDIRQDLLNAKDDDELLNGMIQGAVTRGFQNIGRIMTMEKRKRRIVKDILGDERGNEFLSRPMEPITGKEFEDIFEDLFD